METSLVIYGFNKDRKNPEHLKWICNLCCLVICIYLYSTLHSLPVTIGNFSNYCYIYFVLNSAQSSGKKIIGNVTAKFFLKESLLPIFVPHYSRKRFFRKGFDPEIYFVAYGNLTRMGFLFSRTQ